MSPDRACHWVERSPGLDARDGPSEPLISHAIAEAALVHVQQHGEGVGDRPLVVVAHGARVVVAGLDPHVVVEHLEPAQVPAPALVRVSHQTLVSDSVERGLGRGHAHHGVGATLSDRPRHLPHVQAGRVAD